MAFVAVLVVVSDGSGPFAFRALDGFILEYLEAVAAHAGRELGISYEFLKLLIGVGCIPRGDDDILHEEHGLFVGRHNRLTNHCTEPAPRRSVSSVFGMDARVGNRLPWLSFHSSYMSVPRFTSASTVVVPKCPQNPARVTPGTQKPPGNRVMTPWYRGPSIVARQRRISGDRTAEPGAGAQRPLSCSVTTPVFVVSVVSSFIVSVICRAVAHLGR